MKPQCISEINRIRKDAASHCKSCAWVFGPKGFRRQMTGRRTTNQDRQSCPQTEVDSGLWRIRSESLKAHLVRMESTWRPHKNISKDPSHYKITLWRTHRWQFFRTTVLKLLRIWNYKSFRVCFMGQYFSLKLTNIVCVALWCEISPSVNAISIEM